MSISIEALSRLRDDEEQFLAYLDSNAMYGYMLPLEESGSTSFDGIDAGAMCDFISSTSTYESAVWSGFLDFLNTEWNRFERSTQERMILCLREIPAIELSKNNLFPLLIFLEERISPEAFVDHLNSMVMIVDEAKCGVLVGFVDDLFDRVRFRSVSSELHALACRVIDDFSRRHILVESTESLRRRL